MFRMTVKRHWELLSLDGEKVTDKLAPGTYEMERIKHSDYNCYWLVLKGTRLGASEGSWRQWRGVGWGDFEVIVEPM